MNEKKLKPFDLEKAKQGAKVVTRDGKNVRIICCDRMHKTDNIVALVQHTEDGEIVEEAMTFTNKGTYHNNGTKNHLDLFMAPTTVERWVNVYKDENGGYYNGSLYDSEEMALQKKDDKDYIATTKITWEE